MNKSLSSLVEELPIEVPIDSGHNSMLEARNKGLMSAFLTACAIIIICFCVLLYQQLMLESASADSLRLTENIAKLEAENSSLDKELRAMQKDAEQADKDILLLLNQLEELETSSSDRDDLEYYRANVTFTVVGNLTYHKLHCDLLQGPFSAYGIDVLNSYGYVPCSQCFADDWSADHN